VNAVKLKASNMPLPALAVRSLRKRWSASAAAALLGLACAGPGPSAPETGESAPADPTVAPIVQRAERSRADGDFDTAIQAYGDAFGRTPWNTKLKRALAVTHSERAAAARDTGKLEPAERDLRAALELYPADTEFRRSLAVVLLERSAYESDPTRAAAYRVEVKDLAPDLPIPERVVNPSVERQLDLAFELIERGQLDAGIADLERVARDYPGEPASRRLLAQALVRRASELSQRENYEGARESLDRAVELYGQLAPCNGQNCDAQEQRVAHYNRVIVYINLGERDTARGLLAQASALGMSFPDLERALSR
jgi:tetratricopeptide (TPR) repeat protein